MDEEYKAEQMEYYRDFDPDEFNLAEVNDILKELNRHIIKVFNPQQRGTSYQEYFYV